MATKDLNTFIANAARFFPETEWKITVDDMTIKSANILDALKRLPLDPNKTVKFDAGYANTFPNTFPVTDFSNVKPSDEQRAK